MTRSVKPAKRILSELYLPKSIKTTPTGKNAMKIDKTIHEKSSASYFKVLIN